MIMKNKIINKLQNKINKMIKHNQFLMKIQNKNKISLTITIMLKRTK